MKKALLLVMGFAFSMSLSASHLLGGQISVVCQDDTSTTPLEYMVTLTLIRDASGINLGQSQTVNYESFGSWSTMTVSEVLRIPAQVGSRAVELVMYTGMVDLTANVQYEFWWSQCCRPSGILNMSNSGGQAMYYWAYVNTMNNCNSTPQFLAPPMALWPDSTTWTASLASFDLDGDSLHYVLDTPYTSSQAVVSGYTTPSHYPGTVTSINPVTGSFTHSAMGQGTYSMLYEVRAYDRSSGALTGLLRRDTWLEVVALTSGNLVSVNPPSTVVNNAHEWLIGWPDTLIYTANSSDPVTADFYIPSNVDSSLIYFNVDQFKNGVGADVSFAYTPTAAEDGMSFPVVIRFTSNGYSWDEDLIVSARQSGIGINEYDAPEVTFFPNPTTETVTLRFEQPMESARIIDVNGRVHKEISLSGLESEWSGAAPEGAGVYFIHLTTAAGMQVTLPLVVK